MSADRDKNIIIPFCSGVSVDVENTRGNTIGKVWTISEEKPELSDIDLTVSLGFPDTYVLWLNNSRQFPNNHLQNGPVREVNNIILRYNASSQDVVDMVAKITRDSWNLDN